jgi:PleD family two-component response regulator
LLWGSRGGSGPVGRESGSGSDMPRPRVLLFDDSRTAQATHGRGLEKAGFEVLVAGNAMEAGLRGAVSPAL